MPKFSKIIAFLGLTFLLLFEAAPSVLAESTSTDISYVYAVSDEKAVNGDILTSDATQGIVRAKTSYDPHLFGVLQNQPLMVFKRIDNQGIPITRNGTAQVNVTTLNGPINAGDPITSSEIPGKGQKASGSGYILGIALKPFTAQEGSQIDYQPAAGPAKKVSSGIIPIALKIEYAELTTSRNTSQLLNTFGAALFQNVQDPNKFVQVLRYLAAAVVVLITFGIGFLTFSRSIPKGIEAIGRNPLAEKAILLSIVLNIFFTFLTAGVGIVVAILILRI